MKGKCTKLAFFSQVNWHLQIFRHRIIFAQTWKRSTNRSLIQTFLAYLDKLNIPLPQGRFFGANSGEHHQRIKEQIYLELWANPRINRFCFCFCFSGEEAGQSGQKSMPEPMISHLWSHILETLILRRLCLALSSSQ